MVVRLDEAIAVDTDTSGRTRVGTGGQAANVAAWVVALGGRASVVCRRAHDPAGQVIAQDLTHRGVAVRGPVVDGPTGTVVSLATPDGRRAMLTDRGVAPQLRAEDVDLRWPSEADWLHVPGYSLTREPVAGAALAAAGHARRVSLDLSSSAAIRAAGVERFRECVAALAPELVLGTEEEHELVGPLSASTVVVKLGADGCRVNGLHHAARPATVVDGTGAGDAFAAGFLTGGVELALEAGARCVAKVGSMP